MDNKNSFKNYISAFVPLFIYGIVSLLVETVFNVFVLFNSFDVNEVSSLSSKEMMEIINDDYAVVAPYMSIAISLVCIPLFIRFYIGDKNKETRQVTPRFTHYAIIAIMGILSCICFSNFIEAINMGKLSGNSGNYDLVGNPFVIFIATAICSPIIEELLFRGLMFARFRRYGFGYILSTISVSLTFAVLHGDILQGAYAFLVSLFFCYMYEKNETVIAPVIMHLSANIFAYVANRFNLLAGMYEIDTMYYVMINISLFFVLALLGKNFEIIINKERVGKEQNEDFNNSSSML